MRLEEFARVHNLPERWLLLRQECEELVKNPAFWSRPDLQESARRLATEASNILQYQLQLRRARAIADCAEGSVAAPEIASS